MPAEAPALGVAVAPGPLQLHPHAAVAQQSKAVLGQRRGAAFAVACALLAAAGLVSLRIDTGARVFRWAARGAGA